MLIGDRIGNALVHVIIHNLQNLLFCSSEIKKIFELQSADDLNCVYDVSSRGLI